MKTLKLTLIVLFLTHLQYCFCQPANYSVNINFETGRNLIHIDTANHDNVWQIGIPSKIIFDSAYSKPFAIVTDTSKLYPLNNHSSFEIDIKTDSSFCWGTGYLSFEHKFNTDSLKDGGYVEISYDSGKTWQNIILDKVSEMGFGKYNFYSTSDTIIGNIPAFTGNSNGWKISGISWIWVEGKKKGEYPYFNLIKIRFNFKSSANSIPKEGWMIDNISFDVNECSFGIKEINGSLPQYKIFPNPFKDYLIIEFDNNYNSQPYKIEIFDMQGRIILNRNNVVTDKIYLYKNDFTKGTYLCRVTNNLKKIINKKFIVE